MTKAGPRLGRGEFCVLRQINHGTEFGDMLLAMVLTREIFFCILLQ